MPWVRVILALLCFRSSGYWDQDAASIRQINYCLGSLEKDLFVKRRKPFRALTACRTHEASDFKIAGVLRLDKPIRKIVARPMFYVGKLGEPRGSSLPTNRPIANQLRQVNSN